MRFFVLTLLAVSSLPAQNVMDIVPAYSEHQVSEYDRTKNYTYQERVVTRKYKRNGTLKSTLSETYEVLIVNGAPVDRLIQRNGKPVTEQESLNKQREFERVRAKSGSR